MSSQTTLKQKILLVCFGLFLTLLLLEIGLRAGGFFYVLFEKSGNAVTFQDNEIRILCVGDSMTALGGNNSYPSQLEGILNSRNPAKKFSVINEGMVSANSEEILAQLKKNLNKYRPAIVISMMGINDHHRASDVNPRVLGAEKILKHFRTYKLFQSIRKHIQARTAEKKSQKENINAGSSSENLENKKEAADAALNERPIKQLLVKYRQLDILLRQQMKSLQTKDVSGNIAKIKQEQVLILAMISHNYRVQGDYKRAMQFGEMAIASDPKNYSAYVELGLCFKEQKEYQKAIFLFTKAIQVNPASIAADLELARCYELMNQSDKTMAVYRYLLEKHQDNYMVHAEVGGWLLNHGYYKQAAEILEKGSRENIINYKLYEQLAEAYQHLGEKEKSLFYFQKWQKISQGSENFPPTVAYNYNELAETVFAYNAKLIGMQYPLRDVSFLKNVLAGKSSIAFIDNKDNFKDALKSAAYTEYFTDSFGGNFGHCTPKGNRLMAENAADAILKMVSPEGK